MGRRGSTVAGIVARKSAVTGEPGAGFTLAMLRSSEGDIAWWHGAEEGFAGRKPLSELPLEGAGPVS